jgi:hypothetical protein
MTPECFRHISVKMGGEDAVAMKLLTRADFDGICCAALLKHIGVIDSIQFEHPRDIQSGKAPVDDNTVIANAPYVEGCALWFDHHLSEAERLKYLGTFNGLSATAPSAARVIYDYYGGPERFSAHFDMMMKYVDIVDSASFGEDDVLDPEGWILFGFICDPRSGLDKVQGFSISNEQLMQNLTDHLQTMDIEQILELPDVRERTEMYFQMDMFSRDFLMSASRVDGPVVITDTRGFDQMPPGNRFLIYSLFPETNISIRLIEEDDGRLTIAVGHSVMNRTSRVNVGTLMLRYGGGGHARVGTCTVSAADSARVLSEIVKEIKTAG